MDRNSLATDAVADDQQRVAVDGHVGDTVERPTEIGGESVPADGDPAASPSVRAGFAAARPTNDPPRPPASARSAVRLRTSGRCVATLKVGQVDSAADSNEQYAWPFSIGSGRRFASPKGEGIRLSARTP